MMLLRSLLFGWLLLAAPALAGVTVTFYSRDTGAVLQHFPHGYFAISGRLDAGGPPIDANYGFTARMVSPAILLGSVAGEIVAMSPGYVAASDAHMRLPISDADYARLMALVERWRAIPGKSYNLRRRNCVFFVAEAARLLGLDAPDDPKLMLKPRSYLASVTARNAAFLAARRDRGAPVERAAQPVTPPLATPRDALGPAR